MKIRSKEISPYLLVLASLLAAGVSVGAIAIIDRGRLDAAREWEVRVCTRNAEYSAATGRLQDMEGGIRALPSANPQETAEIENRLKDLREQDRALVEEMIELKEPILFYAERFEAITATAHY